jgi:hypothetical protein
MLITTMPATAIRTIAVVLSGLLSTLPVAELLDVESVFEPVGKVTAGIESTVPVGFEVSVWVAPLVAVASTRISADAVPQACE